MRNILRHCISDMLIFLGIFAIFLFSLCVVHFVCSVCVNVSSSHHTHNSGLFLYHVQKFPFEHISRKAYICRPVFVRVHLLFLENVNVYETWRQTHFVTIASSSHVLFPPSTENENVCVCVVLSIPIFVLTYIQYLYIVYVAYDRTFGQCFHPDRTFS